MTKNDLMVLAHMFRKANNRRAAIYGYGSSKPTAEALQELARKAAEWNEQYDAVIDAGGLPEALAGTPPHAHLTHNALYHA